MTAIDPILKHVDSFTVAGLMVRTKNSDEFNQETAKLPHLWQQFYSSNPTLNIPIFGVYSGYESDANGFYDVTVGTTNNQSIELSTVQIHAGNYLVFEGKGGMPQTVIEVWTRVWDYFTDAIHQRSFVTDFEMYSNGDEVSIYIGVQ